jgi:hypothetical protein
MDPAQVHGNIADGAEHVGALPKASQSVIMGSHAGLPVFQPPGKLPVDLNEGFPDSFIRKAKDDEATPVEVVIDGVKQAGFDLRTSAFCTFRCPQRSFELAW